AGCRSTPCATRRGRPAAPAGRPGPEARSGTPGSCATDPRHEAGPMDLSDYVLEPLRQDGELLLSRGRQRRPGEAGPPTILLVTPLAERPAPDSLRRMEQEYSLRAELDPAWAAQPLALVSHQGRTTLVLTDPGGEPLERLLGSPLELTPFLRLA